MRKAKWIALLVVVCVCVTALSAYAQLPSGNWPKFGRDYYNSSKSPATVIAKPIVKWAGQCKPWGGAASQWYSSSYDGVKIDASGNVYAYADYCFGMAKFNSAGTLLANDTGVFDGNLLIFYGGPTLYDDGTNQLVVCPPQHGSSAYTAASGSEPCGTQYYAYTESKDYRWAYMLDMSLQSVRRTPLFNMANVGSYTAVCGTGASVSSLPGWTTHQSPAIGHDGTAYIGNFTISYFDPFGPLVAFNPLDGSIKWSYTDWGMGRSMGTPAIKTVDDGGVTKNVIYVAGGQHQEFAATFGAPSIFALRDDGTAPTLLWKKSIKSVDDEPGLGTAAGFFTSCPVLSSDGSTLYAAGRDAIPLRRQNVVNSRAVTGTLFAYNADTGALKWKISTGGTHAFSPALGANGMIYLSGGHFRTGTNSRDVPPVNTPGKVIAVKDNGTSAEVKWTLELPDDVDSDTTTVATTSTTPTTMYVASGNGRVFCIQDQGTYGKLLWTWHAFDLRYASSTARGYAPTNIAIADDGTAYIGIRNFVYAFDATGGGFNPNSPDGISGYVRDAAGNPVAGAWVSASSASANPLADNVSRIWTKTNPDGSYQISPKNAGTYNVAAGAVGYAGTAAQTADQTTLTNKVTLNFTLEPAKYNWAFASTATCSNSNASYPAANAVDGDLNTRWQSTAAATVLNVDLGAEKTINEAVIYWHGWYGGASYSVQYSLDGSTGWTNAYTTAAGNGGFPIDWLARDPTVSQTPVGDLGAIRQGCAKTSANIIMFAPIAARYWRVNVSTTLPTVLGSHTDYNTTRSAASIWEFELRDSTKTGPIANSLGAARAAEAGEAVSIPTAVVTAVAGGGIPADTIFVQSEDRTAGMRVQKSGMPTLWPGDKVALTGHVYINADGERYIDAMSLTRIGAHNITGAGGTTFTSPPNDAAPIAIGMNNRSAAEDKAEGLFVKTWGKVVDAGTDYFTITDGSPTPIKVKCGAVAQPALNTDVRVRGVPGKDSSGPVLYMRGERTDWTSGSATYQALPFVGQFKFPTEYLVLGPFVDTAKTYEALDVDYIGGSGEAAIRPNEGMVTAGKTWTRVETYDAKLNLLEALGTGSNATAYVHLYIWSDVASPSTAIATGSDDWLIVWVNGVQVSRIDENATPGRTLTIGEDYMVNIDLNAGLNSVLFKVVSGTTSSFGLASQIVSQGDWAGAPGYGGYGAYTDSAIGYSLNNQ